MLGEQLARQVVAGLEVGNVALAGEHRPAPLGDPRTCRLELLRVARDDYNLCSRIGAAFGGRKADSG